MAKKKVNEAVREETEPSKQPAKCHRCSLATSRLEEVGYRELEGGRQVARGWLCGPCRSCVEITNDDELLKHYIFDESKLLRRVPYQQFLTKQDNLAIGLLLPVERVTKEGNIYQEWQATVITSGRTFHTVFSREHRALGVKFEAIPVEEQLPFSLHTIPEYLKGERDSKGLKELFQQIKSAYEEYLYLAPAWYSVHAVWDIATYFWNLFPAFPYLELRGVKGAAKTKLMRLSRNLTFHSSNILTNPSEASLFRIVHDQRPTLYLDECENLFRIYRGKVEHDGRVEIINSGYTEDGRVPRVEKRGNRFVTEVYATYCPKMLASINGLHGATESRAIIHVMTRAPDKDPRGEREVDIKDNRWQEIRDNLFFTMMASWDEVRSEYNASQNLSGLKKRELQLWRPLLAIARLIGKEVEQDLLTVARHQQDVNRAEDLSEDSWEFLMLQRMHHLLKGGQQVILFKELAEAIPLENRPGSKGVRTIMDRLGFHAFWVHSDAGNGYRVSLQDFEVIAATIAPSILSSFPSTPSESHKSEVLGLKETEEKGEILNLNPEDAEAPEGNEGHPTTTLAPFIKDSENGQLYSLQDIALVCHISQQKADRELRRLQEKGDVFQPKPGRWGVLQ